MILHITDDHFQNQMNMYKGIGKTRPKAYIQLIVRRNKKKRCFKRSGSMPSWKSKDIPTDKRDIVAGKYDIQDNTRSTCLSSLDS